MKIAVMGLGYVGSSISLCLAEAGHEVHGYDISNEKVRALMDGRMHLFEPGLQDLLNKCLQTAFFPKAEVDSHFCQAEAIIVCVGTPVLASGQMDSEQIENAIAVIQKNCQAIHEKPVIFIRSTVYPGLTDKIVTALKKQGFETLFIPEFLREGSAIADFASNPLVVGAQGPLSNKALKALEVFPNFDSRIETDFKTAEMAKYLSNSYHALKVAFANETGSLAKKLGLDNEKLFEIFFSDRKLNISSAYLKPGFSYGGYCLPKDLSALNNLFLENSLEAPLLKSISESNSLHILRYYHLIKSKKLKKLGFAGAAFKENTDDARNSPVVKLINLLSQAPSYKTGQEITVFDSPESATNLRKSLGAEIALSNSMEELVKNSELIVWGPVAFTKSDLKIIKRYRRPLVNLGFFSLSLAEEAGLKVDSIV